MSRDALVVGINTYQHLQPLKAPAEDAEAIAQRLEQYGNFQVRRLPEFLDPFEDYARQVGRNQAITSVQLEEALVQLFKPTGKQLPDTALFFFSGHGLRKDRGIQEGFLATSEVNPAEGNWGLSLQWLRRLLQESSVRQQIVWLDCCYSGELLNFADADPGDRGRGRDRCFIAASREYEVAFEDVMGQHSVLTRILLEALQPQHRADGLVTNLTLTNFIQQSPMLRAAAQHPLFANSGNKIILLGKPAPSSSSVLAGICPYKGLTYFDCNDTDPQYFHGRTALTDALLEKVREGNFLAILGASGSGKSSVLRAGLLHQLKLGQRLSGSHQWAIHLFRPGEQPLQNLALAFLEDDRPAVDRAAQLAKIEALLATGATGLAQLARANPTRLVLVIDQFEELFTLCQDDPERQQFCACVLGALEQAPTQLSVILTLRADFFGKCLERSYSGLASKIQAHLVTVTPMNREELEQAITEPAKQVGLDVEQELVTQIIIDVERSPGSLPLLQYTLTELWKQRSVNWLTFSAYNQSGGVRGTLQKRADQVYQSLDAAEQTVAQQIFLALTQLGEGTEDTRRQVLKQELMATPEQAALVDRVIATLAAERLIVTSELVTKGWQSQRVEVVDVAHEALIRYWPRLRQWIEENRGLLKQQRELETAANAWQEQGQPQDRGYLLQGRKLVDAEEFLQHPTGATSLSTTARQLIRTSQVARRRMRLRNGLTIAGVLMTIVAASGFAWQQQNNQRVAKLIRDTSIHRVQPELLPVADELRREADALAVKGNVEEALTNYRVVLNFTTLLANKAAQTPPDPILDRAKIQTIAHSAETALVKLIREQRLPQLETELRSKQFGQRKQSFSESDLENRFTNGALKTTYALLLRELGVKADLNDDGAIKRDLEADRLPCELLQDIEALWRRSTHQQCGWYNRKNYSVIADRGCRALDGGTLVTWVFDEPNDFAIARLNACKVAPKPLQPYQ